MKTFEVGDLVKVNFREWKGKIGCIYEIYQDFDEPSKHGVQIILQDGEDLGGFSYAEQQAYLDLYTKTDFNYTFTNVIQLDRDFEKGMFNYPFSFIR